MNECLDDEQKKKGAEVNSKICKILLLHLPEEFCKLYVYWLLSNLIDFIQGEVAA